MPRVDGGADVTLVVLVYRSMEWLTWCMRSVDAARTRARYRWLVVANDAEGSVISGIQSASFDWLDHRNDDPEEYYINRVYTAWNHGVLNAPTEKVVMLNSDMAASDDWLDELLAVKAASPDTVPTSLLVESGRIPSGMPEYVRDFGQTPATFDEDAFRKHAKKIRVSGRVEPGRLFMPILVKRQEFLDLGGYPEENPPGSTGDKELIRRYTAAGFRHVTAMGSVCYHVQEGEMRA